MLLRTVLGEPDRLRDLKQSPPRITSELTRVECLRTLDRLRLENRLSDEELAERRGGVLRILDWIDRLPVSLTVLQAAAEPLPVPLGTLDAIHLATARMWRNQEQVSLTIATHDRALARAARAVGMDVLGD